MNLDKLKEVLNSVSCIESQEELMKSVENLKDFPETLPKKAVVRLLSKHLQSSDLNEMSEYVDQNEALKELKMLQILYKDNLISSDLAAEMLDIASELPDLPITEEYFQSLTLEDMLKGLEVEEEQPIEKRLEEVIQAKNLAVQYKDTNNVTAGHSVYFKGVGKSSKKRTIADYYPDEEQLEEINRLSKIDLEKNQVVVFTLESADSDIDRHLEKFSPKALKKLASGNYSNPILLNHRAATDSVAGFIYRSGEVKSGKLIEHAAFPLSKSNEVIVENILNGMFGKLSVGFTMNWKDLMCNSCGKCIFSKDCSHMPGMEDEKGQMVTMTIADVNEKYETSIVPIPAQRNAHIQNLSAVQGKADEFSGYLSVPENQKNAFIDSVVGISKTLQNDKINIGIETTIKDSVTMAGQEVEKQAEIANEVENAEEAEEMETVEAKATEVEPIEETAKSTEEVEVTKEQPSEEYKQLEVNISNLNDAVKAQDSKLETLMGAIKDLKGAIEVLSVVATPSVKEEVLPSESKQSHWIDRFAEEFTAVGG